MPNANNQGYDSYLAHLTEMARNTQSNYEKCNSSLQMCIQKEETTIFTLLQSTSFLVFVGVLFLIVMFFFFRSKTTSSITLPGGFKIENNVDDENEVQNEEA